MLHVHKSITIHTFKIVQNLIGDGFRNYCIIQIWVGGLCPPSINLGGARAPLHLSHCSIISIIAMMSLLYIAMCSRNTTWWQSCEYYPLKSWPKSVYNPQIPLNSRHQWLASLEEKVQAISSGIGTNRGCSDQGNQHHRLLFRRRSRSRINLNQCNWRGEENLWHSHWNVQWFH